MQWIVFINFHIWSLQDHIVMNQVPIVSSNVRQRIAPVDSVSLSNVRASRDPRLLRQTQNTAQQSHGNAAQHPAQQLASLTNFNGPTQRLGGNFPNTNANHRNRIARYPQGEFNEKSVMNANSSGDLHSKDTSKEAKHRTSSSSSYKNSSKTGTKSSSSSSSSSSKSKSSSKGTSAKTSRDSSRSGSGRARSSSSSSKDRKDDSKSPRKFYTQIFFNNSNQIKQAPQILKCNKNKNLSFRSGKTSGSNKSLSTSPKESSKSPRKSSYDSSKSSPKSSTDKSSKRDSRKRSNSPMVSKTKLTQAISMAKDVDLRSELPLPSNIIGSPNNNAIISDTIVDTLPVIASPIISTTVANSVAAADAINPTTKCEQSKDISLFNAAIVSIAYKRSLFTRMIVFSSCSRRQSII